MVKFRIACHVCTWGELTRVHTAPVFRQISEAGYEGVEGLWFDSAEDLVEIVSEARTWGLHMVSAHARTPGQVIRYNAALGNKVCEVWEGPMEDLGSPGIAHEERFPLAAKYFKPFIAEADRYKMRLHHHIHLGQLVVTMEHVELLVRHMPDMGILLDTGHLAAAGGDAVEILHKYGDRVAHVHLKDFYRGDNWNLENMDFIKSFVLPGMDLPLAF